MAHACFDNFTVMGKRGSDNDLLRLSFYCTASEMIVTRSFPVGSLIKEKKIGVQYLQHLEQWLHECIQLRSSTFQVGIEYFTHLVAIKL